MSDRRNPFECSPEILRHLKDHASPCASPHVVINQLIRDSTDDPATRCMTVAALVATLSQLAGPAAIERPPGCLLVNAGQADTDPINDVMRLLTGISNPPPTASPGERQQPRDWMFRLALDVTNVGKAGRLTREFLGPRMAEFRNARCQAFGADRFGFYADRHDEQLGWVADISNHVALRLDREIDLAKFRADVRDHSPCLTEPVGIGETMRLESKVLSVAGTLHAVEFDEPLVTGIVDAALPVVFLPHCAAAFLHTPPPLALQKLSIDLEHFSIVGDSFAPSAAPSRLPTGPWFVIWLARLRQRLLHFPEGYDFFIRQTIRDLRGWCRQLSRWATKAGPFGDERKELSRNLTAMTLYGVSTGVEALGWHGYGFDAGCDRRGLLRLLSIVRKDKVIERRELQRRLQSITAGTRDDLLVRLASEGLVNLNGRLVEAVPLADYIRTIPTRSGVSPPKLATCTDGATAATM